MVVVIMVKIGEDESEQVKREIFKLEIAEPRTGPAGGTLIPRLLPGDESEGTPWERRQAQGSLAGGDK